VRKLLLAGMAVVALLTTAIDTNAQAGGITKGGKTQSWKFADSITTSTVHLFPSYESKSGAWTADSFVLKPVHANTFVTLDSLTATRRVKLSANSYFKGGELLYFYAKADSQKLVVVQSVGNDTFTVDPKKRVGYVYTGSSFHPFAEY